MRWKPVPVIAGVALAATIVFSASAVAVVHRGRAAGPTAGVQMAAAAVSEGGVSVTGTVGATRVSPGTPVTLSAKVESTQTRKAVVDIEVHDAAGTRVFQKAWTGTTLTADRSSTLSTSWTAPDTAGIYRVAVGVFEDDWASTLAWQDTAGNVTVTGKATGTTTPSPRTTPAVTPSVPTTTTPTTTTPTTTASPPASPTTGTTTASARFDALAPTAALPTEAQCAEWVRAVPTPAEVKGINATPNRTTGRPISGATGHLARVTGNFTGTTEQILRWAACKWGVDEDIVKAQAATESWWRMDTKGDEGTDASRCAPGHGLGVDGTAGRCPESWGLLQIRYPYNTTAFPDAITSSAFNADYAYAQFRACYTGEFTWLNTVERTGTYAAGDAWGCLGVWFSGRWHTDAAEDYIARVKSYRDQAVWTTANFKQP